MYYRLNESIVPDYVYDGWARELARLHEDYPEMASIVVFHEYFQGFTGETVSGFDLPTHDTRIIAIAQTLLKYHYELKASTK